MKNVEISVKQFNKIIKAIARKDKNALEELYSLLGKMIFISAKSITHSTDLADEVVDDVLFKIWTNAHTYPKLKNPVGWLYIITVNCAKDRLKREKSVSDIFDFPDTKDVEEIVVSEDKFYHDILCLNEAEQEIMIYRFIEDLSFERIAKEIRKPLSTITSIYYRALEKIRKKF